MGGLQRLPRIVGLQAAAELAFTGRTFHGPEAARLGLVLRCFESEQEMLAHVYETATLIASKSPLTTRCDPLSEGLPLLHCIILKLSLQGSEKDSSICERPHRH